MTTPAIRIVLLGIGVGLWIPLAIIVGCKGGMCGHAWDTPPGSLRHRLFDLLAEHRLAVGVVFFAYGIAVAAVFRREIAAACTRSAVFRVVGLIAVALALVGAGLVLSKL